MAWGGIEVGRCRSGWENKHGHRRGRVVARRAQAQWCWTTSAARRSRPRENGGAGVEQRSERTTQTVVWKYERKEK